MFVWRFELDGDVSQGYPISYQNVEGGQGESITLTSDGGFAVTGQSLNTSNTQVYLAKFDAFGEYEWHKKHGDSGWETGFSVVETESGGFTIAGFTYSFGSPDMYVVKTKANGTLLSDPIHFGGSEFDISYGVAPAADGGLVIAGSFAGVAVLKKLDAAGNPNWEANLGATNAFAVARTPDNGFVVTGSRINGSDSNIFLIKTDENGNF